MTFNDKVTSLNNTSYSNLIFENNEIVQNIDKFTKKELISVLQQYSIFSNEAIHMLLDACIRNHDWKILQKEILRNISEELGSETRDIPHLELMRQGYREELLFDPDLIKPWACTYFFLEKMKHYFRCDDNNFSAGCLYAFETHAIQEFHIVEAIFNQTIKGTDFDKNKSLLVYYIRGHKEFEIGHSEELYNSIAPYFKENETDPNFTDRMEKFTMGYNSVSNALTEWWINLYSKLMEDNSLIKLKIEMPDLRERLFEVM